MDLLSVGEHVYCVVLQRLISNSCLLKHVRYARGSQVVKVTTVQPVQTSERLRECVRQSSFLLSLQTVFLLFITFL
jgi:hypothetical protein